MGLPMICLLYILAFIGGCVVGHLIAKDQMEEEFIAFKKEIRNMEKIKHDLYTDEYLKLFKNFKKMENEKNKEGFPKHL